MASPYKMVPVKLDTYQILVKYKSEYGSFDAAIKSIVKQLEECNKKRMRLAVCNSLHEVSASPVGWAKLFKKYNVDPAVGFSYLKPHPSTPDLFVVNMDKCKLELLEED